MNSIDNEYKTIQYNSHSTDPLTLAEYYIKDCGSKKYIIFKFNNNLNQDLYRYTINVDVYNKDNKLIERTSFKSYNASVLANQTFLSKNKLEVLNECEYIKIKLISAEYKNLVFENGKYTNITKDITANLKDSLKEEKQDKKSLKKNKKRIKKMEKANKKAQKKLIKSSKKNKGSNKFSVKQINLFKLPGGIKFLLFLLIIASIGGLIYSNIYFTDTYGKFATIDNITYQIKTDTAQVYEGDKESISIEIPQTITYKDREYSVTAIAAGAFKKAKVETLTLNRLIKLYNGAFENSNLREIVNPQYISSVSYNTFKGTKLTSVELINVKFIYDSTFATCSNLKTVLCKNAKVYANAFKDSLNISSITIYETDTNQFIDIFSSSSYNGINSISIMKKIDTDYTFKGIFRINYLTINQDSTYVKEDNVSTISLSN